MAPSAVEHNFITEYHMECASPSEIGFIASSYFLGWMIGSLIFSPLSDLLGRKKSIIAGLLLYFFGTLYLLLIAHDKIGLYIGMFLVGVRTSPNSSLVYILITEYTDMKSRPFYTITCLLLKNVMHLLGGIYYSLGGHYKPLLYFGTALSFILSIWTYFGIPESPRYLKVKEKVNQAIKDFRIIAKLNNRLKIYESYLATLST